MPRLPTLRIWIGIRSKSAGEAGTGEVHHGVDGARDPDVLAHVVLDEREAALAEQLLDVGDGAGDQVVDGDHLVPAPAAPGTGASRGTRRRR